MNILISTLVNVGDVIMMTAALDLIKQENPAARLSVLARPEATDILRGNPLVDQLILYPYRSGSPLYGLGGLLASIRAGRFDTFLSLDRRPRGAAAAALAGIKKRLGPDLLYKNSRPKFWTKLLFTRLETMTAQDLSGSQVEMFQQVARKALGLTGRGRITLPPVTAERRDWVQSLFAPAGGRPVVGLCVRTNDAAKTWPMAGFAAVMRRLYSEFKAFMYLTGAPADRGYTEELAALIAPVPVLNLAGKTSFGDIQALAACSHLCIAPDNGAGHLMANSGLKNLVCVLVSTPPEMIIDSMPQARFVRALGGSDNPNRAAEEEEIFQAAAGMLR